MKLKEGQADLVLQVCDMKSFMLELSPWSDPLGDGISKVEFIDSMGHDLRVVNAARVSMDKESNWIYRTATVKQSEEVQEEVRYGRDLNEKDKKLIDFLNRDENVHWTPFAHCAVTLKIKMPIFVERQYFKHTIGFVRSSVSRRYVKTGIEFYYPEDWRLSSPSIKQGSIDKPHRLSRLFTRMAGWVCGSVALRIYNYMIEKGVCAEQARMILPQNMYTEFYETASLYAYARMCKLRLAPDAQKEIRLYAQEIEKIMRAKFPEAWKSLERDFVR